MEPTIGQLRDRYAAMENDELVELHANNQLTDTARSLIDEELRARAIDPKAVESQQFTRETPESSKARMNAEVALSQASNPVEIFRAYWAGKGPAQRSAEPIDKSLDTYFDGSRRPVTDVFYKVIDVGKRIRHIPPSPRASFQVS
jgi:hypothetical protein